MIKIQNIKRSKKFEISFELVDDKNKTSVPLAQVVLSDRIKSDFIIKLRSLITSIITYDGDRYDTEHYANVRSRAKGTYDGKQADYTRIEMTAYRDEKYIKMRFRFKHRKIYAYTDNIVDAILSKEEADALYDNLVAI